MPYVQEDMKGLNRRAVFDLVSQVGEISRVDISNTLGTSGATVLKITNFFLEQGYVVLAGSEKTTRGRHPQILRFNPDSILGIGVDYNGNTLKAAVCNYWGQQLVFEQTEVDGCFHKLVEEVLPKTLQQLLKKYKVHKSRINCIGICVPGAADTEHERIELGPLSGIRIEKKVSESIKILSSKMKLPVYLFNDVNAAATGEYVLRKLKDDDLVYISVGDGLGAGIILDGRLRSGKHWYTGEIAHMVFDSNHVADLEKPGWMEEQLSKTVMERKFGDSGKKEDQIDDIARQLSLVVANVCNVLDVQGVILGGGKAEEMGQALIERVRYYTKRLCLFDIELQTPMSQNSSLVGVVSMALSRQLDQILSGGSGKK